VTGSDENEDSLEYVLESSEERLESLLRFRIDFTEITRLVVVVEVVIDLRSGFVDLSWNV
jgi:hypothetical protein